MMLGSCSLLLLLQGVVVSVVGLVSLCSVQKDVLTFASLKCVPFRVSKRFVRAGVMVSAISLTGAAMLAEAAVLAV